MIKIIWPQKRFVSDEWITSQYNDAVANGMIALEYQEATDVWQMVAALEDAGIITVGMSR